MARLQILELPVEQHGDDTVTPYLLVIDQVGDDTAAEIARWPDNISSRTGARHVLCFGETVEIPANDNAPDRDVSDVEFTTMATAVRRALGIDITEGEPDIAGWLLAACRELEKSEAARAQLRDDRAEARMWARHGYEIGQRHCSWTDHGVAPAWLTDGWPPHFDSCEHLKRASDYDEALTRVRNLSTEPEVMNADQPHQGVWLDGYRSGVLAAKSATRPRDEKASRP